MEFRHKSFFFLKKLNQNQGGYTCLVNQIIFAEPNTRRIEIIGAHQENESNRSVVGISIRNQTHIQQFPRGFGEVFPNLKYFEVDNASITMLSKEDFSDLGHLQGLWMPRNPIVVLPSDLFANVQGLRFLSFHKNKLKYIGHDILKPLKNLERANFCENTTIDMSYNGGPDQLAALNREIATKCIQPSSMALDSSPVLDKINELVKRIESLELRCKKLELEKRLQAAEIARLVGIPTTVEDLQRRVGELEVRNIF